MRNRQSLNRILWSAAFLPLVSLTALSATVKTSCPGTFTLVGAEKSAKVVIPENAEPSTKLCVEELTNYVAKITGVVLPVDAEALRVTKKGGSNFEGRGEPPRLRNSVIIGTLATLGDATPVVAREALAKSKKFEAAWTGMVDGNLWIVGKETTADLYATYHFLESQLGVRWMQAAIPQDPGDWYPTVKVGKAGGGGESGGLVIQNFQEFREPDFVRRIFGQQASEVDVIPYPGVTCGYRNGFQYYCLIPFWTATDSKCVREHRAFYGPRFSRRLVIEGGHWTCYSVFPGHKYLKTDPELFALQNGVRGGGKKDCEQYCLSNPRLIDGLVKHYVEFFRKNDGRGIFAFGQSDATHGWCECEKCCALDAPGEGPVGNSVCVSSRLAWFANQLFTRIHAQLPEVEFIYEPYAVYRKFPGKGRMAPDKVTCQYSPHGRCYQHRFDDATCPRNAPLFKEMHQWWQMLPEGLWTYEYFSCTPPQYVCREIMEAEDLRLYKKMGMLGWFNEGMQTGAKFVSWTSKDITEIFPSNWQWLYTAGHLMWDADRDLNTLLDDVESKYYGPAYPAMKKYHALRREIYKSQKGCMGYPFGDPLRPVLLNAPGAKEKLLGYLAEAEKLVDAAALTRQPVDAVAHRVTQKGGSASEGRGEASASTGRGEPPRLLNSNSILKFRLSRDRKWLNDYWVKPNDKQRYEAAHAIKVPRAKAAIAIDGNGTDPSWADAVLIEDRFKFERENEKYRKPAPPQMKAQVKMLWDDDNLYFLCRAAEKDFANLRVTAKKPDEDSWGDDCFEIFLYPPAIENRYYHLAVNSIGTVYDARCPGGDKSYNLGAVAKGGRTSDGWCVELKVPSKNLYPLKAGEKWRFQISRGKPSAGEGGVVTIDGFLGHDTANYPSFELLGE